MSFRTILFCLFLYICLVWVGAVYFFSGPKVEDIGLLWTAAGLGSVLLVTVVSRVWSWGRVLRARAAARPKAVGKPLAIPAVPEDEAAVLKMLEEAKAALSRAPAYANDPAGADLTKLPVYFLVGPEGSGKTSTFVNSGLSPQLLAGEASGQGPYLPTRVCNIWFAEDALWVEIGGRAFTSDRLAHILVAFLRKPVVSGWRGWFSEPPRSITVRGVLAFCDVKEFSGSTTPQARERLDRLSREWHERIGRIAEIAGSDIPLILLITRCDTLPYFGDFFRRIAETEAEQVFGCAVAPEGIETDSDSAESKRLAKSFSVLYHALAERRLQHLSHEPDPSRRPNVYEFPREMKRIRPAVVQFLTTVFRSHPLRPNPRLLGFYFSGVGERQVMPMSTSASTSNWSETSAAIEASVLFDADATKMLGRADASVMTKVGSAAGTTRRWLFVTELFAHVVTRKGQLPIPAVRERLPRRRARVVCLAVCALCLLLCFAFATSWSRNLTLLNNLRSRTDLHRRGSAPSIADLQGLEGLRTEVAQLSDYQRTRPPLSERWGLYTGNRVVEPARELYFRRFEGLLLAPINNILTAKLLSLPSAPSDDAPYTPVYNVLQTHLILSGACKADVGTVSEVLKGTAAGMMSSAVAENWRRLAYQQIDFYTGELAYGNPAKLKTDSAARDQARRYLGQIRGADRIYARVLSEAQLAITARQRLRDSSPDYRAVLNGPDEIDAVFSRDGFDYVDKASRRSSAASSSEACILGGPDSSLISGASDTKTGESVRRLFLTDYVDRWRKFIEAFSLKRYTGPADAAHKLDILADHKSPLLALMALASKSTNFPPPPIEAPMVDRATSIVGKFVPSLKDRLKKSSAAKPGQVSQATDQLREPWEVTRRFQPVHVVVAPGSDTWVTEKNNSYVQALQQLGHAMQDLARSPAPDPALVAAASQSHDKALDAVKQLALGFEPLGVSGLDMTVERLLEAPIRGTEMFIIDPNNAIAGKVNAQLRSVCAAIEPALHKFPFHSSTQDASMAEFGGIFAPGSGAIWKFQADSLGEFTVKEGQAWKSKDPAKKPGVTQEMLNLLNRSQAVADSFYPAGSTQPRFAYTLRPKLDQAYKDAVLELEIDGQVNAWTSSLQKQFTWPGTGNGKSGVVGRIRMGPLSFPFASRGGPWAIFRVMNDAELRPLGSKLVEWKYLRGGDGRTEEIQPVPVRLEFVEFPGGVDLFNPKFFDGLQCPTRALQP